MEGGCYLRTIFPILCLLAVGGTNKSGPDLEVESSGDDDDDGNIKQVVWQRQAWCLRSHRRCSGDMQSALGEDYEANRVFLDSLPSAYEIVYPTQFRRNELQLTLSTRDHSSRHKHAHYHHTIFQVNAFGHKLRLKMELNKELLRKGLRQKRNVDEKTQMITEGPVEHCYYHGNVKKVDHSQVAISTCYGLSGVIMLPSQSFIIQPLQLVHNENVTRHPHVVYQPTPSKQKVCGNDRGMWQPLQELHHGEYLRKLKIMNTRKVDSDATAEMKYLELGLVLDNTMYDRLNQSYGATVNYAIQQANIMDAYYRAMRVQLHLVFIEVWNLHAQFHVSPNARETLHTFMRYWETTAKPVRAESTVEHDVVHFITARTFDHNEAGMAIPDSVCSQRAVSVSQDPDLFDPQQGAVVAAHMIGHTLGMHHDTHTCNCSGQLSCIMDRDIISSTSRVPQSFSQCSDRLLNESMMASLGACLFDRPYEISYEQTCGNRKQERGEECDCGNSEECALWDPCCDNQACLLKPYATCRRGGCCHNCTVMAEGATCRSPLTNCDVPEFCDGITGDCPRNELVQDGQPCSNNNYCFQGLCHSRSNQCFGLWGEGAQPADEKCYEKFNVAGNFNGHCGKDPVSGAYRPCQDKDLQCGLLHCSGGQLEPRINDDKTFSRTTVVDDNHHYQCKIVNSGSTMVPDLGMVEDGSRCGDHHLCYNRTCVPVSSVVKVPCPLGPNNLTCSGNGLCTTANICFCSHGFMGNTCSEIDNRTTTAAPTTTTTTTAVPIVRVVPVTTRSASTTQAPVPATTTLAVAATKAKKSGLTTIQLIVVLACVAGVTCMCLGFFMLCYRRRSPRQLQKVHKRKSWFSRVLPPVLNRSKSSEHQSSGEDIPRLISFGNMPSYRADKIKALRRSMGQISEGGSEQSVGSAHSAHSVRSAGHENTEIKIIQAINNMKQPERGILKKKQRSVENVRSPRHSGSASKTMSNWSLGPDARHRASCLGFRDSQTLPACLASPLTPPGGQVDSEGRRLQLAASEAEDSESSIEKKEFSPSDDDDTCESDDNWKAEEAAKATRENAEGATHSDDSNGSQQSKGSKKSPTSPSGLSHSSSGSSNNSLDGAAKRAKRLKNLTAILDQIDKQAHALVNISSPMSSVPPNVSPKSSQSDEMRNSEPESDRQYPRSTLYQQHDDSSPSSPPPKTRKTHSSPVKDRQGSVDSPGGTSGESQRDNGPLGVSRPLSDPRDPRQSFRKSQSPVDPRAPRSRSGVPPEQTYLPPLQIQIPEVAPPNYSFPARDYNRPTPPRTINPRPGYPLQMAGPDDGATPPPSYQDISPPRRPLATSSPSVPYRGTRQAGGSPPTQPSGNNLSHPLLDGYPYKRNSPTTDGHSTSEGYHSDRADPEEPLVARPSSVIENEEDIVPATRRDSYHLARELNERVDF